MTTTLSLTGDSSILEAEYYPPIQVGKGAKCGLVSLHTTNSIPNISAGNNRFYFGGKTHSIPTGAYELEDIIDYLKSYVNALTGEINFGFFIQKVGEVITHHLADKNSVEEMSFMIKIDAREVINLHQHTLIEEGKNHFFYRSKQIRIIYPPGIHLIGDILTNVYRKLDDFFAITNMMKATVQGEKSKNSRQRRAGGESPSEPESFEDYVAYEESQLEVFDNIEIISELPFQERKLSTGTHDLKIFINKFSGQVSIFSTDTIDFTKPFNIGKLLGFNSKILKAKTLHISDNLVSISSINNIAVHCNLISGSYTNNHHGHIIHEFNMEAPTGYKISEVPRNVIYYPMTVEEVTSITVKITNQSGELIDLRNEQISIRLHIDRQ